MSACASQNSSAQFIRSAQHLFEVVHFDADAVALERAVEFLRRLKQPNKQAPAVLHLLWDGGIEKQLIALGSNRSGGQKAVRGVDIG